MFNQENYTTTDEVHNSSAKYQFSTKPDVSFAQNRVDDGYSEYKLSCTNGDTYLTLNDTIYESPEPQMIDVLDQTHETLTITNFFKYLVWKHGALKNTFIIYRSKRVYQRTNHNNATQKHTSVPRA